MVGLEARWTCRRDWSGPLGSSPTATLSRRFTGLTAATMGGDYSPHPNATNHTDAPSTAITVSSTSYTPRTGTPPYAPARRAGSRGAISQHSHASFPSQPVSPPVFARTASPQAQSSFLSGKHAKAPWQAGMSPKHAEINYAVSPSTSAAAASASSRPSSVLNNSAHTVQGVAEPHITAVDALKQPSKAAAVRNHSMHGAGAYGTSDIAESSGAITPAATEASTSVSEQLRRVYGSPGDAVVKNGNNRQSNAPEHAVLNMAPPPQQQLTQQTDTHNQGSHSHPTGSSPAADGDIDVAIDVARSEFSSPHWPSHSLQSLPSPFAPPVDTGPVPEPAAAAPVQAAAVTATTGDLPLPMLQSSYSTTQHTHTAEQKPGLSSPGQQHQTDLSPQNTAIDSVSTPKPIQSVLTIYSGSVFAPDTSLPATSGVNVTSASDPFLSKPVANSPQQTAHPSRHSSLDVPLASVDPNMARNNSTAAPTSVATGPSSMHEALSSVDGGDAHMHGVSRSNNASPAMSNLISTVSSGSFRKVSEARGVTGATAVVALFLLLYISSISDTAASSAKRVCFW